MATFRSNSTIHVDLDVERAVLLFEVKGEGRLELYLSDVSDQVRRYATLHGLKQRICDVAALGFNEEESRFATPAEKFAAMRALVEHYASGSPDWSVRGPPAPRQSLLVRCLIAAFPGKSEASIEAYVKGLSAKQKRALLASEALASHRERLAPKPADAEAQAAGLLAQLG